MSAIEQALLAVMAAGADDQSGAHAHISRAQQQIRTRARRERQIVEIAALIVAEDRERAVGLALEHLAEFPEDDELLARIAPASSTLGW